MLDAGKARLSVKWGVKCNYDTNCAESWKSPRKNAGFTRISDHFAELIDIKVVAGNNQGVISRFDRYLKVCHAIQLLCGIFLCPCVTSVENVVSHFALIFVNVLRERHLHCAHQGAALLE